MVAARHAAGLLFASILTASSPEAAEAEKQASSAVVLMYHRFGEDRFPSTSIRLDQFDAQLGHLEQGGFEILPLGRVVAAIRNGGSLPDSAVAITVDDAYLSVYEEAFPRLKARGWPFTVFVSTDAVDEGGAGFMSWDQMREMRSHGVTFANHTATHDSMTGDDDPGDTARRTRLREEIERAQRRLREELGDAPKLLAYPYGDYDAMSAALVLELGFAAFGQQSGALGPGADLRALPRFPMAEAFAGLDDFRVKVRTLPLPVREVDPWSPVTRSRRPELRVLLSAELRNPEQLACYAGGQGRIDVRWLETGRRFAASAKSDLPLGPGRYNCTAPSGSDGRYFWYSHPWIVRKEEQRRQEAVRDHP